MPGGVRVAGLRYHTAYTLFIIVTPGGVHIAGFHYQTAYLRLIAVVACCRSGLFPMVSYPGSPKFRSLVRLRPT
jgi:hypothetical protein